MRRRHATKPECMAPPRIAGPQPGGEPGEICAAFPRIARRRMPSAPSRGRCRLQHSAPSIASAYRPPQASGRRRPPAIGPLRTDMAEPGGVGRCRTCCGNAEHGECGEDPANAAVVHGLAPCGLGVSPLDVGAAPSRRQYRFVRIPIRTSNERGTEEWVRLSCRRGIPAFRPLYGMPIAGTSSPAGRGAGRGSTSRPRGDSAIRAQRARHRLHAAPG